MVKQDLQMIYFGQNNPDFDYKDLDLVLKVNRLAKKHQKQCVNSCNGYGVVKGQVYYNGMSYGQKPGEYEKREYGYNVKSAYIHPEGHRYQEENVFDDELEKLQLKINKLVYQFNHEKYALYKVKPFKIEFQHDPRGTTVKLTYNTRYIQL